MGTIFIEMDTENASKKRGSIILNSRIILIRNENGKKQKILLM